MHKYVKIRKSTNNDKNKKNYSKRFEIKKYDYTFAVSKIEDDSVAQQVEHRPFKAGVLGSNPSWITQKLPTKVGSFFIPSSMYHL